MHNTILNDPNIPIEDAIQANQNSLKDIETLNMLVSTITDMKSQIKHLETEIVKIKNTNTELKTEVDTIKNREHNNTNMTNETIKPKNKDNTKQNTNNEHNERINDNKEDDFHFPKLRNKHKNKI